MWAFSVHQLAFFSLDLEVQSPTKTNSSETVSEFKQGPKLSAINTQLLIDKRRKTPQMAFNRQKLIFFLGGGIMLLNESCGG